ncbi:MmcQ/YjbR family DNA-binding protein [uncultured Oscillibacter sp.]|uniref:MmcQ/YjbR family DNA-binding protein n=1 Tax=uncultured Oscillibacter sp. TaxID=876091 RepID=UPI0026348853|nr:MmcQ/YjbR family DNA-binding protein [uncultured Oscillibacter sp.]
MPTACRDAVLQWIGDRYGAEPEYLWRKYPTYAVFRRQNNRKWFAALMEVSRKQLGLEGAEMVDILDLKCDPRLIGTLRESPGFLPAYHMNKANWITVLLDGSVTMEDLMPLLDLSYDLANGGRRRGPAPQS